MMSNWHTLTPASALRRVVAQLDTTVCDIGIGVSMPLRQTSVGLHSSGEVLRGGDSDGRASLESLSNTPAAAVGFSNEALNIAHGRDVLEEMDYGRLRSLDLESRSVWGNESAADGVLAELARVQGFDRLPVLGGPADVDAVVAARGQELFRGVNNPRYAEEFKTGPYFAGQLETSSFGAGTYASTDREVALGYANDRPEGVIRMALRPGARVTDIDSLSTEMAEVDRELGSELRLLEGVERSPEQNLRRDEVNGQRDLILSDMGRYATARGYDAYHLGLDSGDPTWVLLNRSALTVER